jgi:hypothetical protein
MLADMFEWYGFKYLMHMLGLLEYVPWKKVFSECRD